ncbi:hypothetical protein MNBD_PLANCTO02-6 [hydrothermal vent metagenome]|uniref:Sodium/calcium exchanger membrane region domain-containing protein n=1 Tax=hydrothermal vent metagenome TaxID=652676 RepID=A0A3B1D5V1_9ZZZZ
MSDVLAEESLQEVRKPHYLGLLLTILFGGIVLFFNFSHWELATHAFIICFVSLIIWQLCEPFADAAQWIGDALHMPSSVRGATLDAVASSLPEFFIGIFFVLTAVLHQNSASLQSESGYGATVATCAGSAIYNMILIPAFVALVVSYKRKERPTIDIEDNVIARDGIAFLLCEGVLLIALHYQLLTWWMGIVFIAMYCVYILFLYNDWKKFETIKQIAKQREDHHAESIRQRLQEEGHSFSLTLIEKALNELQRSNEPHVEREKNHSFLFFNMIKIRLNAFSSWGIVGVVTLFIAGTSYILVHSTHILAEQLHVPTFFLAVIVVAAASSVPDTFVSIAAAMRGDDSGAVSNVFGSNIFNICVCLGVPLIINSGINNWEPVSLMQNGKPMEGLFGLQVLLGLLTTITLAMMWHNRQITRTKAIWFCGLYGIFITYAVAGSLGLINV